MLYRRTSAPKLFLAALLLNPDRCRQWVKAIGDEDFVYLPIAKLHQLKFVCGHHFAPAAYKTMGADYLKMQDLPST